MSTEARYQAFPRAAATPDVDDLVHRRADKLFLVGAMASGSFIAGPVGLVLLTLGARTMHRAKRAGVAIRDWKITVMAVFCLVDAGINMIGWSLDLFAHDTVVAQTVFNGYGRTFEAGYYLGYNSGHLGGNMYVGEKVLEIASIFLLFPMRIAACWAFMRMKRWGLQYLIFTSWLYCFMWIGYLVDKSMTFTQRFGYTEFGFMGFWMFNIFFWTPFLMLPYLYTVRRQDWSR